MQSPANLLHSHGVSQEESLVVSDPENKEGVAVVKMPGPGQLVCSEGCTEPGSVIRPRSPCSSQQPHPSLPLCWAAEALRRVALPVRPTYFSLAQSTADNSVVQPPPQWRDLK